MKKKFFGSKMRAALSVLLCLVFAVAFWFLVKYSQLDEGTALSIIRSTTIC